MDNEVYVVQDGDRGDILVVCRTERQLFAWLEQVALVDRPGELSIDELKTRFHLVVNRIPFWN